MSRKSSSQKGVGANLLSSEIAERATFKSGNGEKETNIDTNIAEKKKMDRYAAPEIDEQI